MSEWKSLLQFTIYPRKLKTFSLHWQIDSLEIRGGFTWGAQLDYFLSPNLGLELSWTQQETALGLTASGRNARLFDVDAGQLHAGVLYQFGGKREGLRPFVLGTFGATFLRASDVASATKFSWAVGGGLKAYLGNHLGLRFQARYDPTRLGDGSSGEFCDPFGFCADTLHQFELGVGVLFRF